IDSIRNNSKMIMNISERIDNVRDDLIKPNVEWRHNSKEKKLKLLWGGQSIKLFELLRIRKFLESNSRKINLIIVTNSLNAINKWYKPHQKDFEIMLNKVNHSFIPFTTIENILYIYGNGGVFIAPRFLDNTYNLGHTEWKITLAMARGRPVLCSEQPSYVDLAEKTGGRGVFICRSDDDWQRNFENLFRPDFSWINVQKTSASIVKKYYAASVIAKQHADFVARTLDT
ncbi:hypothetical protein LCGC14_2873320, partial [marine sediment metagenome]